jgi:succinylarginine dihydrolase
VIDADQLPVADAIESYLFNSQLVSLPNGEMALLAQTECQENRPAKAFLDELPSRDTPIRHVQYVPVRQSMGNGGGLSCLRLRVILTPEQLAHTHQSVFLTPALYEKLCNWVTRHYREHLSPTDLTDPQLVAESRTALDELTQLLDLGSLYAFQRTRSSL